MPRNIPAFVPQIADLLNGVDYDLVQSIGTTYESDSDDLPIEDPENSFTSDNTRERPVRLTIVLSVGSHPIFGDPDDDGQNRIAALMNRLLRIKSLQAVSPSAYFTVQTGLRTHRNCLIKSIKDKRRLDKPSVLDITLSLVEKRFSTSPQLRPQRPVLDAGDGPFSVRNERLIDELERINVEAEFVTRRARTSTEDPTVSPGLQLILNGVGF